MVVISSVEHRSGSYLHKIKLDSPFPEFFLHFRPHKGFGLSSLGNLFLGVLVGNHMKQFRIIPRGIIQKETSREFILVKFYLNLMVLKHIDKNT